MYSTNAFSCALHVACCVGVTVRCVVWLKDCCWTWWRGGLLRTCVFWWYCLAPFLASVMDFVGRCGVVGSYKLPTSQLPYRKVFYVFVLLSFVVLISPGCGPLLNSVLLCSYSGVCDITLIGWLGVSSRGCGFSERFLDHGLDCSNYCSYKCYNQLHEQTSGVSAKVNQLINLCARRSHFNLFLWESRALSRWHL